MKKTMFLFFAILARCLIANTWLESTTGIEWEYSIEGSVAIIIGATPTTETLVIPKSIDGYDVTCIYYDAFSNNCGMKRVEIPEGITNIYDRAFQWCQDLESVSLSSSVKNIGVQAFILSSKLTQIEVSESNLSYKSIDGVLFNKDCSECPVI